MPPTDTRDRRKPSTQSLVRGGVPLLIVAAAAIWATLRGGRPHEPPAGPPAATSPAEAFPGATSPTATSPAAAWPGTTSPVTPRPAPTPPASEEWAVVTRVVDGDTLVLAGNRRLRLIGVNTPETVKPNHPVEPFGAEATAFTKQMVQGQRVRLVFDGDRQDQYGRMLAYVWAGDRMLNEELLRAGLARMEPQYNYSARMKARYAAAQDEARAARRGIWSRR